MVSQKIFKDTKWITPGIKNSNRQKNKLYKKSLKKPNKEHKDIKTIACL